MGDVHKAITAVVIAAAIAVAIAATVTYASAMTYSSPSNYGDQHRWVPTTPNCNECNHRWGEYSGPHAGGWARHNHRRHHPCLSSGELINVSEVVTKVDEGNLSLVVGNETVYLRGLVGKS